MVSGAFSRVQLFAVGRERHDPHILREVEVPVRQIEASYVLVQNMDSIGIALLYLPIEISEVLLIDGLGQQEPATGQPQADGSIYIALVVGLLQGSHGQCLGRPHILRANRADCEAFR